MRLLKCPQKSEHKSALPNGKSLFTRESLKKVMGGGSLEKVGFVLKDNNSNDLLDLIFEIIWILFNYLLRYLLKYITINFSRRMYSQGRF